MNEAMVVERVLPCSMVLTALKVALSSGGTKSMEHHLQQKSLAHFLSK